MISKLAEAFIQAKWFTEGRNGMRICKITPHIMAAKWTGKRCADFFAEGTRQASANYCIGYDGDIVCAVKEEDRSWASANGNNDRQAITIECANDVTGGDWHISDATWNSLVELCVDICKRYDFKLEYDGTPNGSLTRHNMFINTTCPGPYLQSRLPELAETVNKKLEEEEMRFNKLKDIKNQIPDVEFYDVIRDLIIHGYIKGISSNDDVDETVIDLSYDMIRMFVINYRAGLYT